MLPSYSSPHFKTRDHIHLGAVPLDGSPPSGFGANGEPPYTFSAVKERTPHLESIMDMKRSLDGTPFAEVLLNDAGNAPLVFRDFEYEVRCTLDEYDLLEHMVGRRVYLVDVAHCANDQDHESFVKIMFFASLEFQGRDDQFLVYNNVRITLKDMNTKAAL